MTDGSSDVDGGGGGGGGGGVHSGGPWDGWSWLYIENRESHSCHCPLLCVPIISIAISMQLQTLEVAIWGRLWRFGDSWALYRLHPCCSLARL